MSSCPSPRCISSLLVLLLLALFTSCGGNDSSTQILPPPPPAPDFTFSLSLSSLSLDAGSNATLTLTCDPSNGFSSPVSVAIDGVPQGVSVSPSTVSVTPGTPASVTLTASLSADTTTATVTVTASSGSLQHSATLALQLYGIPNKAVPTRTGYVRTGSTVQYWQYFNSHWLVLDKSRNMYFAVDPYRGEVTYMNAITRRILGRIAVPGAFSISETADNSRIYVATDLGNIYAIDPAKQTIVKTWLGSQIGPSGFPAIMALPLADGRVALLGWATLYYYHYLYTGSSSFAVWNPSDNSIQVYTYSAAAKSFPTGSAKIVCGSSTSFGTMNLSADRTRVIVESILSDGTICSVNVATGADTYNETGTFLGPMTVSPDGKWIVLPTSGISKINAVEFLDANTLVVAKQFDVDTDYVDTDVGATPTSTFSPDGSTLYTADYSIAYAYNVSTGNLLGWTPNLYLPGLFTDIDDIPVPNGLNFQVVDDTGQIVGVLEQGIGFLDVSGMQTGPVGTKFRSGSLYPQFGPIAGGTESSYGYGASVSPSFSKMFLGGNAVSTFSSVSLTTPPGKAGPADIYAFTVDGGMQFSPEAFSYGPFVLGGTPIMATEDGGGPASISAYGLGTMEIGPTPSDLNVTIGGSSATITFYDPNAYIFNLVPPFPVQGVDVTIPPGTGNADLQITNASGSTTVKNAITYIPPLPTFSATGAALAQGIYDEHRDVYYFTDANQLRVFSLTQKKWLTPIVISGPKGERLWGLSLSPDGSKLAIADIGTGNIYLLNPDTPTSVQTFANPETLSGTPTVPVSVTVGDDGVVFFTAESPTKGVGIFSLNTSSSLFTDLGIHNPGTHTLPYDQVLRTRDGKTVYANLEAQVWIIDVATGTASNAAVDDLSCYYGDTELAISPDQSLVTAGRCFYDANLNAYSRFTYDAWGASVAEYAYGAKFSADDKLLFEPGYHGIDLFDASTGHIYQTLSFSATLSANFDALVSNGKDNVLLAITGTKGDGIAVIDLSPIPSPAGPARRRTSAPKLHILPARFNALPHTPLANPYLSPSRKVKHPSVQPKRRVQYNLLPKFLHPPQATPSSPD